MEFSANSRDKICNGRCRPSTNSRSHRSDTDLERPLFLLHKIEPTARRSSFADQTMREPGRWMMAGIEHVVRSAQNVTASGHDVRSERSPLHDVRQHATCTSAQGGAYACADSFSDEPLAHSRTSIDEMESLQADRITAGGARRDRTDDLLLAKQALSQLSYSP